MPISKHELSEQIASVILKDIQGRKGLGHEWDVIDEDIRSEIFAEWVSAVETVLQRE